MIKMSLLEVKDLTKQYGTTKAVEQLSFTIDEGRCVALLGPNGAGKTTTLKMLSGLLTPTSGMVRFMVDGVQDIRQAIGFLPQYPAFYNWMTGREYLEFTAQLANLNKKEAKTRTIEMLELVGLTDAKNRRIGGYSGGMKQRLGLAQAMIHKPKLIILDEPVSALDPLGRREVLELMRKVKQETTILFSTHVLHDAEEVCDDILIIQKGELAIQGSIQEIKKDHQLPILIVQVESGFKRWLEALTRHSFVESFELHNTQAKLQVKDVELARTFILKDAVEKQVKLHKFEVGQTTLEDLFIKVVQA